MPASLDVSSKIAVYELRDNFTGGNPYQKTQAEVWKTPDALNFVFIIEENHIKSYGDSYNQPLWKGDTAEIMITLNDQGYYLETEVNPDGIQYAVLIKNRDMNGDIEIEKINKPPFTSSTERTENGWRTAIELPFGSLKELGWTPENCFINLFRQDYREDGDLKLYALSPTLCSNFHKPRAFIPLNIKE